MHNRRWSNEQLRTQVEVVNGTIKPHMILKKATYLNTYLHQWLKANIWIYEDRIVYVGENLPDDLTGIEMIDCKNQYVVPGYIEPHCHPYQLYNPVTFAEHGGQFGTTTFINDNLTLFLELSTPQAFKLIDELKDIPSSLYWWCRFDSQTDLPNNDNIFNSDDVLAWLNNENVIQGGELTAWPKLLNGDNTMLSWVQETKSLHKKVEGHFPGASERTLAKMMLLGTDCDHEAMTGKEALTRLTQGYTVSLRQSSIRPDLEEILKELIELNVERFDRFFFTTDGSHPYFFEQGMTDELIRIAIKSGIPIPEAYNMASYNIAKYYDIEHLHGSIATGRIANINFLTSKENPTPWSVLSKGEWIKKEGEDLRKFQPIDWERHGISKIKLNWQLEEKDITLTEPIGIQLMNNVITKTYESQLDLNSSQIHSDSDECYLMMIAKDGSWKVNTLVKGFANQIGGFASSYSGTGDILIIGKNKSDMIQAFQRVKELGGGIVLVENDTIIHEIELPLSGIMSKKDMHSLIQEEVHLKNLLKERGFSYNDPSFTLLFFSATHLPFIRITPSGLIDVKANKVLLAPTARNI